MFRKLRKKFNKKLKRSLNKKDINKNELVRFLKDGAILVDVRSPQEYREGHLEGAMLIPEYELMSKHSKIFESKDEIIVLYCSNGLRSKKAQRKLEKLGYTNVYNLVNDL
ncbi:MAG: rhodanese-like domain-containing protein [Clostridia bacterium]|nr:rhodanese-like domain-containing protein [Clostridia bacterium]